MKARSATMSGAWPFISRLRTAPPAEAERREHAAIGVQNRARIC
jgi:hypothetical protein